MSDTLSAPKGVPEYLPPESGAWLAVREALTRPAVLAGYGYIELPIFEDTALYVRGVGESTDVVSKEMYTFTDRGDRSLTLRPEGTAGVMRSVIEHRLDRGQLPVKLWYTGPFFRAERPQHGRYRQLQQFGVEAIGSDDPALDAEVVSIADEGYRSLGLTGYRLELTSLGCRECRPPYRETLVAFLEGLDLDEATRERARINPLRVLDDKRPEVIAQLADAPLMLDHLCEACAEHFAAVRRLLDGHGTRYVVNPRMVRGLDYYTRTTFEFVHDGLGAQSGIGGGGRYDGLMADLGGQELSGIGFGLGLDRTYLACQAEGLQVGPPSALDVYVVPLGAAGRTAAPALVAQLRRAGLRTDQVFGERGLKGAMKSADRSGAPAVVVLGERDLEAGVAQVKTMASGEQVAVPLAELVTHLTQQHHTKESLS
ncbi:histidine--tRNA ligase [Nocardioides sp. dk4132]|uniref:histidine--tRNA ligase n=1 Tax=unclassified Nocardioides TaxID=2615069 RepID=UPI0012967E5A|nr:MULTISPECIES: histidine--tRNA ligase [unclassified Nocardioides]MQW74920.1 histidine--tRNA ligase [Nocardioides sp. dk4132]QGA07891.1 histidine--tRNA ligase [Nocardioides sp. dk884]